PQRVDGLDGTLTVFENIAAAAPHVPEKELRNRLARFLIRGATADRSVGALSGGERFRVALATLLLADPAPQLVVLDEPT
ncbi:ATP-binding cassette domain-containing protein, partial [Burkholderia sp. SIMBA_024]|uniref:ATP-binding cassette domain-containing protein n=1 Tax=Burkholderia sp. SIMBA_024 TaxID=3085768 RepID=UPI00397A414E